MQFHFCNCVGRALRSKCPLQLHLKQLTPNAGHLPCGWSFPQRLHKCLELLAPLCEVCGFLSRLGALPCLPLVVPLLPVPYLTCLRTMGSDLLPSQISLQYCSDTASFRRMVFLAFFRVRAGSSCSLPQNLESAIPTTRRRVTSPL